MLHCAITDLPNGISNIEYCFIYLFLYCNMAQILAQKPLEAAKDRYSFLRVTRPWGPGLASIGTLLGTCPSSWWAMTRQW